MSDIDKFCYTTIKSVKKWQKKIENYSGIDCINIRDLDKNATLKQWQEARNRDAFWFEGFANDLTLMI